MLTLRARSTQTTLSLAWAMLVRLALIALACYVAWRVRFIVVIVLLSIILTFVINPLVDRVYSWRPRAVPRQSWRFIATLAVFLVLFLFCVGLLLRMWAPFQSQLDGLQVKMSDYQAQVQAQFAGLRAWYDRLPEQVRTALEDEPATGITKYLFALARQILESTFGWASHVWELLLIPVLAFYFCLDSRSLKREVLLFVPYRRTREALFITRHASRIMQSYIVAQLILCVVAGVTVGVFLWAMHVPYSLVLGVLAGVTRAVPIVGPIFSAIPITLLALTISLNLGVYVLVFFCLLHLLESKVLLPELVGHSIKLHPAIILIVLLIGAEFFGVMGMFLAAPVTAIGRMLLNLYLVEPALQGRKGGSLPGGREDLAVAEMEEELRKVS